MENEKKQKQQSEARKTAFQGHSKGVTPGFLQSLVQALSIGQLPGLS